MTSYEFIALAISFLALICSGLAIGIQRKAFRSQSRLTDREVELVRLQLSELQRRHSDAKAADVSARLYQHSRDKWRVKFWNAGPAEARNVRVELNDQNSILQENLLQDKFPMKKLEKGQSVEVIAGVWVSGNTKEDVRIVWDDERGAGQTKVMEITL